MGGAHKHRRVCPVTSATVRSGAFDVSFCETKPECQYVCNCEKFENAIMSKPNATPDFAASDNATLN